MKHTSIGTMQTTNYATDCLPQSSWKDVLSNNAALQCIVTVGLTVSMKHATPKSVSSSKSEGMDDRMIREELSVRNGLVVRTVQAQSTPREYSQCGLEVQ